VAGSSARDEPLPLWSDGPPREADFWAVARGALFLILLFWVPRILAAFPQVYVRTPVLAGTEAPPRCHRWGTSRIVGSVLVLKSLELALEDDAGLPDYCALVWGRRRNHPDASIHPDWAMDAGLARRKLAKWLHSSLGEVSNEFFTAHEQEELLQRIAALQDEVAGLTSLNDQQSKAVLKLLGQVQKDSRRLGRKDWLLAGIGAGTALVVTGAVPPLFMLHLAVRVIHLVGEWLTS